MDQIRKTTINRFGLTGGYTTAMKAMIAGNIYCTASFTLVDDKGMYLFDFAILLSNSGILPNGSKLLNISLTRTIPKNISILRQNK